MTRRISLKEVLIAITLFLISAFALIDEAENQSLSREEVKLYREVMKYRGNKGLDSIPLSPSLNLVAKIHVQDLLEHSPKARCNLHSWSKEGEWTSCCYDGSQKTLPCMWNKPRELTSYIGDGYEIAYWSSEGATAAAALNGWKKSRGHNAVVINQDIWKNIQWKAIGIAIRGEYAVVWFGKELDS